MKKKWKTKSGLDAFVTFNKELGFRCGYVGVNKKHPLFKVDYAEIGSFIQVHGGLTFSNLFDSDPLWYFGYDCCHAGDKTNLNSHGNFRTLKYCKTQCELLATQLTLPLINIYFKAVKNHKITNKDHYFMIANAINDPENYFVKNYFKIVGSVNIK